MKSSVRGSRHNNPSKNCGGVVMWGVVMWGVVMQGGSDAGDAVLT